MVIPPIRVIKQKKIIKYFKDNNATDVQSAIALKEFSFLEQRVFKRLTGQQVLIHAGNNKYYLNIDATEAIRRRRLWLVAIIVLVLLIGVAIAVFYKR